MRFCGGVTCLVQHNSSTDEVVNVSGALEPVMGWAVLDGDQNVPVYLK